MNFNVEPYLIALAIISFVLSVVDFLFLANRRKRTYFHALSQLTEMGEMPKLSRAKARWRSFKNFILGKDDRYPEIEECARALDSDVLESAGSLLKPKMFFEYARSLFPIFLLVVVIRSFLFEPFMVPTGSLEPTVLPGDFLLVNKFTYGLRIPLVRHKFYQNNEPQRGDIVVFKYPPNPDINYVKRVVGVPGDRISYINKVLTINGVIAKQDNASVYPASLQEPGISEKLEDLSGVNHDILVNRNRPAYDFRDLVVPKGYYFMMGDNRDDSLDSRYWGFVPERDLVGKATYIWLSKIPGTWTFRWSRVGTDLEPNGGAS